jgi:hypothetical protein
MRLLRLDDHGEILLTDHLIDGWGTKLPKYAILSHTWLDEDQEITLNDLRNGTGTDEAGYAELKFCVD